MIEIISKVVAWSRAHPRVVLMVAILPAILGASADRFVSGKVAFYAGGIQFISLVVWLLYAITLLAWPLKQLNSESSKNDATVSFRITILIFTAMVAFYVIK